MTLIQQRVSHVDMVKHGGREYAVSMCITDQKARRVQVDTKRKAKGLFLGFDKPQISVFRIHLGKVLTSSDRYIGDNYEVVV